MTDRERTRALAAGQPWGEWASSLEHRRYSQPAPAKSRRRCSCCRGRATHWGMANGIAMMGGCEMEVRRWIRDPLHGRIVES